MAKRASGEKQFVTLMYLPGEAGRIRRYHLPRVWITRAGSALGIALVLLCGLSLDYVRARRQVVELERLRSETEEQREQILAYSRQMEDIAGHLDRISQLDRKLRVITNLDPAEPLPLPGIGGIEGSPIEPHQLAGATRQSRHRRMTEMLGQLTTAAGAEAQSLGALISHLEHQTARLGSTPSIAPARGWITSTFGYRQSPFTGGREFHKGLDIAGRSRTPIVASADGDVVFAGERRALGNSVTLRHGYGIETIYGHLEELEVKAGDKVKRGQKIGLMGNTGRSTGPHLHYQVHVNGTPVDPRNYILD
jgi:murein DD-endopeptidase MepM/ murein hydrolase activator NlpD